MLQNYNKILQGSFSEQVWITVLRSTAILTLSHQPIL